MAEMTVKNYTGLIKLLDKYGIDARRIPESSVSEAGYDYWPDPNDESKMRLTDSGGRLRIHPESMERREWPEGVYAKVVRLQAGERYSDVEPDEATPITVDPVEVKPPDTEPTEKPGVTQREATPVVAGTDSTSHVAALNTQVNTVKMTATNKKATK